MISAIFYDMKTNLFYLLSLLLLIEGCGLPSPTTIKEKIKSDTTPPTLTKPQLIENSSTFTYTFTSDKAGTIKYEPRCEGSLKRVKVGTNSISFDTLSDGLYDFCTISILDKKNNISLPLYIPTFEIQKHQTPYLEYIIPIPKTTSDLQPHFTFRSSQAGTIVYEGSCTSRTLHAQKGNNIIKLYNPTLGLHDDCRIHVVNEDGISSAPLDLGDFTIEKSQNITIKRDLNPTKIATLPAKIHESSGLISIDGRLFTLTDSGNEAKLYEIDTFGSIKRTITIQNAKNHDWEDIAQDKNYVYIGDIGNNLGNRRDLKIYKISKKELLSQTTVKAQTISFSYGDQKEFSYNEFSTPYDAEALISFKNKLYIFTKNYKDKRTKLYPLSKEAGEYEIYPIDQKKLEFFVTGADYNDALNIIVLIGYETITATNPHIMILDNFQEDGFFLGDITDATIKNHPIGFRQIEAITFDEENRLFITSELLSHRFIGNHPSGLYTLLLY